MGRSAELVRLKRSLERVPIVGIEGAAGSGKTALALELANDLLESDATVLWLRVRPQGEVESLLVELSELWPTDELGPLNEDMVRGELSLHQRLSILASELSHKKVFLFLDDFHHLCGGTLLLQIAHRYLRGTTLVLTSRTEIELDDLQRVDAAILKVGALEETQGAELLRELLLLQGLDQWTRAGTLERLVAYTRGYPILCKLMVSLVLNQGLTSLEQIHEAQGELYEHLISELEKALNESERQALRRLAVFGIPMPSAALGDEESVRPLQKRMIAERGPGGTYSVHDIFGDYYRLKLPPGELRELHRHCAETLREDQPQEALLHLVEAGDRDEAIDLLLEHRRRFYQSAQYDFLLKQLDQLGTAAVELKILKAEILAVTGGASEAEELLIGATREGDLQQQVQALNSHCHLILEQGLLADSQELARQSLERLRRLSGRRPGRVKALNGLALAQARLGQVDDAQISSSESLAICAEIGDPRGECYAHYARALLHRHKDEWQYSVDEAERAIDAAERARERRLAFLAAFLKGTGLLQLRRCEEASQCLTRWFELSQEYSDPLSGSMASLGYATLLSARGDDTIPHLKRALELGAQHGGRVFRAQLNLSAGIIFEQCGQIEEALARLEEGIQLATEAEALPLLADLHLSRELLRPRPDRALLGSLRKRCAHLPGVESRLELALAVCDHLKGQASNLVSTVCDEDRELADSLQGLEKEVQGRWRPLAARLKARTPQPFVVTTTQGTRAADQATVDELRRRAGEFDLWLDIPSKDTREGSKGEFKLLRRKVMTRLLLALMRSPGEAHTQEEIFLKVWGPPYHDECSAAQVRKNISALRDLLEPVRETPRYIKVREGSYGVKGGYFFEPPTAFCLIEPA